MLNEMKHVACIPVGLFHSGDSHVEGRAACIQDVASSCQKDAGGVDSEWVALHHVTLQAVKGTVLGDLQMPICLCQLYACWYVITCISHKGGTCSTSIARKSRKTCNPQ